MNQAGAAGPRAAGAAGAPAISRSGARGWLPGGVLAAEYLLTSLFVEHPHGGPELFVSSVRLGIPILLAALAGAWLVARRTGEPLAPHAEVPPWRPWPWLAVQLGAFALTLAYASSVLRPGAPPPPTGALPGLVLAGAACALLAARASAPLGWLAREALHRWRPGLLAMGLGVSAWVAAALTEHAWGGLSALTLRGAAVLLGGITDGVRVLPAESVIGLGGFEIEVASVCSGAEGVGLVAVFQAAWLALSRDRLRLGRALLLLPLGTLAALVGNTFRIATLVLVGGSGHPDLAVGGFHSKLGWVLFIGIAFATMALAERVAWFRAGDPAAPGEETGAPAVVIRAHVAPLLAALGAALGTGLWTGGALDRAYGLRVLAAGAVLLAAARHLPRPALDASWVPVAGAALVCAFWIPLAGGGPSTLPLELSALTAGERVAWIAVRTLGSVLVLPVVEELAFRGFLLRRIVSPRFETAEPATWTPAAFALSSAAFGAVHQDFLLGALAGLVFAVAYRARGRLSDAILAHVLANAGVAAAVLLGGRWDLWG